MPITPKIDWNETDESLEVVVHVAAGGKADVFATDCLLKVNAPPYLLITDLYGFVDESRTVASIATGTITFRLTKTSKCRGTWGQLEVSPPVTEEDKAEIVKRRNDSIDRAHARIESERKARLERVKQEEKEATDRQIEMERKRRQEIEERKKLELQEEKRKLNDWQKDLKKPTSAPEEDDSDYEDEEEGKEKQLSIKEEERPMPDHPDYHGRGWRPDEKQPGAHNNLKARSGAKESNTFVASDKSLLYESDDEDHETDQRRESKAEAKQEIEPASLWPAPLPSSAVFKPLPPPRIRLEPVAVQFTKLETSHLPARAQREEEIKVYKKNAKEDQGRPQDSVDVSDRQPVFLKDKGDALYKQGNFQGAINAYKRAVELDPDALPAAWSNMAACHLQLGENEACVLSCSQCIQRLEARVGGQADALERGEASEEVLGFRKMLVKALVRRGQALTNLEQIPLAINDYTKALSYDPASEAIKSDLEELRLAVSTDSMDEQTFIEALRERAGARFAAKDYQGAAEAFTRLVALLSRQAARGLNQEVLDPRITALSNRAACYLVMERYEDTVNDCTSALGFLPNGQDEKTLLDAAQAWNQPQVNIASRVLARRGAAEAHMKRWEESVADYSLASSLARMLIEEAAEGPSADEARKRVAQLEGDRDRVRVMLAQ